jgi:hypothetical protein
MTATNRKTSKAALSEAVDSFFYSLEWLTGGTTEETLRQADHGIKTIEERAATVAALAANPSKLCAADAWLMNRALNDVPARVESYRTRYVGRYAEWKAEQEAKRRAETEAPANVIAFRFA